MIQKAFDSNSNFQAEVYLSLMPQELSINGQVVRLSYRLVKTSYIKQITVNLTDITEKIVLEKEFLAERQQLKMVLNAMRYQNNVRQSIHNLLSFCETDGLALLKQTQLSEQLPVIFRMIHTFKGDFAQWSMHATMLKLHALENDLSHLYMDFGQMGEGERASERELSAQLEAWLLHLDGKDLIAEDLSWIEKYLGEDFMNRDRDVTLSTADLYHFEEHLKSKLPKMHHATVSSILKEMTWVSLEMVIQQYSQYTQDLAESFGKEVNPIRYIGDAVRLDEVRFQSFFKVLIHLFRNAIQYGVESPDEREDLGKSRAGNILVTVRLEESQMIMIIEDDGQGLELPRIISKAIEIYPDVTSWHKEAQMQCIFDFGITTKEVADVVSGRGVGLSAVRETLQELGGSIAVYSEPQVFTRFTLILEI